MGMAIPNVAGENIGASTWDLNTIIRGIDPRAVGYSFDPGYALEEGGVGELRWRYGWPSRSSRR